MLLFLEKIFARSKMKEDQVWFDEQETYLRSMERQCDVYYQHHTKDFVYYHSLASRFNLPILIVSAINALTAVALNEFVDQKFVSIMNAVLSAGTGVLGSIQLYLKINEKMTNATRSSLAFKKLGLKISKELTLGRGERVTEGLAFLSDCFAEFNTALEQGNPVEKSKLTNHLALPRPIDIPSTPTSPRMQRVADSLLKLARTPVGRSTPESEEYV
jgi:hypothetical protein